MGVRTTISLILLLTVAAPALAQARRSTPPRVAFIDMERVSAQSAAGRAALAALQALREKRSVEAATRSKALQAERQKLASTSSVLSASARADLAKQIERSQVDLQRFIEDAQAELASSQRQYEERLLRRLGPAVEIVARQQGIDLVLSRAHAGLVYGNPKLDISAAVIDQLDAEEETP